MSWSVETVTVPNCLPVTLADAKEHLRIDHDDEDTLINRLIGAATEDAEAFQGRAYITRTLKLHLDRFPAGDIHLPMPPLQSVEAICYKGRAGTLHTLSSEEYIVGKHRSPARIAPAVAWPWAALAPVGGVTVEYEAGYGDEPGDVPDAVRQAILLIVGHLYENREAVTTDRTPIVGPMGPKYLLTKDRVFLP